MAYIDPPTFVAGTTLAAADLNVAMDDIRALKAEADASFFTGVALNRTTTLNIVTATWTDIPWDSAPVDAAGWWSTGANVTVPVGTVPPGYTSAVLEIQVTARFATNNTGNRAVRAVLNGAVIEFYASASAINGDTTTVASLVWAEVVDGDVIKGQIEQTSGANLNVTQMAMHVKRIGVVV